MKLGFNDYARVECKRSQFHGHHPVNELCPFCPVVPVYVHKEPDWYMCLSTGCTWDANDWPTVRSPGYIPLVSILPWSLEAKRLCGCIKGVPCTQMTNGTMIMPICVIAGQCMSKEWKRV